MRGACCDSSGTCAAAPCSPSYPCLGYLCLESPEASTSGDTLYDVLGCRLTATSEQVRSAFLKLAMLWHPDRGPGGDLQKFQRIQEAYGVLSNPDTRHRYDLRLLELLDVEEYLSRFQEFILTANGLGMSSRSNSLSLEDGGFILGGPCSMDRSCGSSSRHGDSLSSSPVNSYSGGFEGNGMGGMMHGTSHGGFSGGGFGVGHSGFPHQHHRRRHSNLLTAN